MRSRSNQLKYVKAVPYKPVKGFSATDAILRVLPKLTVSSSTGCIEFNGAHNGAGHGRIRVGNALKMVTHVVYEHYVTPIPSGMRVLHTCDNPKCVNINHLYLGTQSDNMRDMYKRNRHTCTRVPDGVRLGVISMAESGFNRSEIAHALDLSRNTVRYILNQAGY